MSSKPLVTVVMPSYNGEKYVKEAIDSVLLQSYLAIEIIFIDDGSHDATAKIAQSYGEKIHYVFQENRGESAAQNLGISLARGKYITFLDVDDLYTPGRFETTVDVLENSAAIDCVFGHVEQFISPELPLELQRKWRCPKGDVPGYIPSAGLFRRRCFDVAGVFEENLPNGAFVSWYMCAEEMGLKHQLISKRVLLRRIHGNNIGLNFKNPRNEYFQIVKAALQRRQNVYR
jgi:glycosyltransferase involved in cell wall biosynthesis